MSSLASRLRRRRAPVRLALCHLLLASLVVAGTQPEEARGQTRSQERPAVLFLCGAPGSDCQLRTWDDWVTSGFEISVLPLAEASSLAVLRRFNVVVIDFLPPVDSRKRVAAAQQHFEKSLAAYLERGGGVVIFAGGGQWGRMTPALNHLLKPYGARVPDEQVVDPMHVVAHVGVGASKLQVAKTENIANAPMTRGVSRLGYISQTIRADAIKLTQPVVLEPHSPWKVIARAEKTAFAAIAENLGGKVELRRAPAPDGSTPILAAARSVGRGRLFLFPHNIAPTVGSPALFDSYLWNPDDQEEQGIPQDRTFIMQTVRWAAEPSLASGVFGGYRTNPALKPDLRYILPRVRPIDWADAPSGARIAPAFGDFRGLIGAQSTFSGASHTVAELSAAARAAGLSFLGFTERLDRLDPQKWAELKAQCSRESNGQFLAIPGIEALDRTGNRYFALGWGVFPKPPSITADGRRIDQLYAFWAHTFGDRFVGVTDVGDNPNPWFEMKEVSALAVRTVRGERTDDASEAFLRSSYDMENYLPIAFTALSSPAALRVAAAGTVNVFAGASLQALHDYIAGSGPFAGKELFWEGVHPWYVSSGPRLAYDGGLRLGSLGVDEERENTYRYGFRIDGLAAGDRILLMDGPTLFREWRSSGESFATEHTWPHEQTRAFVIRVMRGGTTLLLSSPATLQWSRRFNQCGDRQNTIPYNYEPAPNGNWYVTGVPIGPKYKAWPPSTGVYGTFQTPISAVGVEYTPLQSIGWTNVPKIPFEIPSAIAPTGLASYQHQRLSCPGILIVDETTSRAYPDGGHHPGDTAPPERTEPLRRFNLVQRRYGLYGAIGQLNGQLVESRLRVLEDASLKGRSPLAQVSRFINVPAEPGRTLELSLGGSARRYPLTESKVVNMSRPMRRGDYMGVYPYGLAGGGAQYAISGPLVALLRLGRGAGFLGSLMLQMPSRLRAGQELDYSILYTTGGAAPNRPRSDYASAARFLGLDGTFPAIEHLSGGTLLQQPVIATIQTRPKDVIRLRTRGDPDAPLGLPIRIRGYNPNWQVVYSLDGSSDWRYMGQLDGYFYFHLYTQQGAHTVVAGQPLLGDQPRLRIELDDPLGRQGAFELYNPTDQPMKVHLHTNPAFFPPREFEVIVPPYTSQRLRVDEPRHSS